MSEFQNLRLNILSKTHLLFNQNIVMFTTVWISFLVEETTGAAEAGDEGDDQDGGRRAHHHPDQDCQAESL